MADSTDLLSTSSTLDSLSLKTKDLTTSASGFARAMTQAFSASVTGGKQFDDVLKSLALRISDLAVRLAFKPLDALAVHRRAGTVTNAGAWYGPGSAKQREERCIAPGTHSLVRHGRA